MSVNQLKAGAILNYVVIGLNTLVGLLYTPYMLRMMGQSEYGLYSLVASVISYLTVLDLGLGNAVVRYTAKLRAEAKLKEQYEMFGMFLLLYIVIGIITVIAGMALYYNVDNMFGGTMNDVELSHARIMMLILVFNLAITFPMSIFGSIITAYERFVFPKVVNILRVVLNTVVMICLLHMGYKAVAMVIVQTVFNILTLIINYIYCKTQLKIKIYFGKFKWDFLKEVAVYSFWIFLNVIMDRVYWSTGQFVLGIISGTAAVAVFGVAIQLHGFYTQFSTAISSVFLPKVTGIVVQSNDNQEISNLFIRTGRIQNIIMMLVLSGFVLFGRQFINLWAGPDYDGSYIITLLFFFALYIPLIQNLGITILQARNQMRFRSLLYIVIALVALVFQFILGRLWGGLGCAIAISGALLIGQGLIMNVYYYRKQNINIPLFWKEILRMDIVPIIITFIFVIIFKVFQINIDGWLSFFSWVCVYAVVYVFCFFRFSMNQNERELIMEPLEKLRRSGR